MENNKSIDRSIQQKTLYKALVDAYETDKDILEIYGDTVTFKRRRDDEDENEELSARSNRGSKRRRAGKEPESTSAPKEKTSKSSSVTPRQGGNARCNEKGCHHNTMASIKRILHAINKQSIDTKCHNNTHKTIPNPKGFFIDETKVLANRKTCNKYP
ncbi:hypothetical protein Tco_1342562 [Tanacetum coccineum]